mmetsp:Transcript_41906/g.78361  ORF Transcript_41906/g.78361 Transcript_41906/m.78361 type:complete len:139 (+) Transcript_41906:1722-2138(+)
MARDKSVGPGLGAATSGQVLRWDVQFCNAAAVFSSLIDRGNRVEPTLGVAISLELLWDATFCVLSKDKRTASNLGVPSGDARRLEPSLDAAFRDTESVFSALLVLFSVPSALFSILFLRGTRVEFELGESDAERLEAV